MYVLYVAAADHGTGAGPALLKAVLDPEESVALWVADPNPRAQAFYRKHRFIADGTSQIEGGVRVIRMVRVVARVEDEMNEAVRPPIRSARASSRDVVVDPA